MQVNFQVNLFSTFANFSNTLKAVAKPLSHNLQNLTKKINAVCITSGWQVHLVGTDGWDEASSGRNRTDHLASEADAVTVQPSGRGWQARALAHILGSSAVSWTVGKCLPQSKNTPTTITKFTHTLRYLYALCILLLWLLHCGAFMRLYGAW